MQFWAWLIAAQRELMLFAVTGFLLGGMDDLLVDLVWLARAVRRRVFVFRRHKPATLATLAPPAEPGPFAIFIPAWREAGVIGNMLHHTLDAYDGMNFRAFVGTYPNDPATRAAVVAVGSDHVQLVIGALPGPTTKADCLNGLWRAMREDEQREGRQFKAVVLHDAEDLVHAGEAKLFASLVERFDLVQLPVLPVVDRTSRWIAGTYLDEFAEHHGKTLLAREELGAALPSAGTGCALSREVLERLAEQRQGRPFDADSLTEDYELGLGIGARGGRQAFVRLPTHAGGELVAVRAHFPATLDAAVVQKSRWIAGIALHGWDRMRWQGGVAERWMRVRDRRALLAALVLLAAYASLLIGGLLLIGRPFGAPQFEASPGLRLALLATTLLLVWRLAWRFGFTTHAHGWREGVRSIPRALVSNIIAMMAARRALAIYRKARRSGEVSWDKTDHRFPDLVRG